MTFGAVGPVLRSAPCLAPSSFVGRRAEIREIKSLLSAGRLITLTGPGGVGKSRLAQHAAVTVRRAYPGGVYRVDLADEQMLGAEPADPDQLAGRIATTLELRLPPDGNPAEALVAALAYRPALLLLDNCELLLPACAMLADTLLRACPQLRVLATSREPLRLAGEAICPVGPLPTPAPDSRAGAAELALSESVALFVARAQAISPFTLTDQNAPEVAELCRRLEGLPLAIELAAARSRALTPGQIRQRMAERFGLLSRGDRTAPTRHRTLRACVDWSFELCSRPERLLWTRLAVFHETFELDAVEAVCLDEPLAAADLLDHVAGLVDKSVLVTEPSGTGSRYRMLATFAEYGRAKLVEAGRYDELRRRHRDWYRRLAREAADDRFGPCQAARFARLDRELPNLRAALAYSLADEDGTDAALAMAGDLWHLWAVRGQHHEGRTWLERALARPAPATIDRLAAAYGNTALAAAQGDLAAAGVHARQAREVAAQLGGDGQAGALAECAGAALASARGEPAEAVARWQRAVEAFATDPAGTWHAEAVAGLGMAAAVLGDADTAARCHQEITTRCPPPGESRYSGVLLGGLALALAMQGDRRAAEARLREAVRRLGDAGDLPGIAWCLRVLAWVAGRGNRAERAATLLGAATGLAQPVDAVPLPVDLVECARHARRVLGERGYQVAFARGAGMSADEAIGYARQERGLPAPPVADPPSAVLTRREQEVADLVAQGRSNRDIAAVLVISRRTAESHVDHILTKLGLANRAQIAAWVAARRSADEDVA